MQTTSSPTSATPSNDYKALPFFGWSALAVLFVVGGFASQASAPETTSTVFYDYSFAVGDDRHLRLPRRAHVRPRAAVPQDPAALGLNPFGWRWVGIAIGFIIGVLTRAAASGAAPARRAGAGPLLPRHGSPSTQEPFSLNGIIISTVVPFTEELFFRGLGVRALSFVGGIAAVVITGVVFGLSHGILGALPPLILFGIALGLGAPSLGQRLARRHRPRLLQRRRAS